MGSQTYFNERLAAFDNVRWSVACREMRVRLMNGDVEQAHEVLREFCRYKGVTQATMQSPTAAVIPPKLANMLEEAGYLNIQSLAAASDTELAEIDNVGPGALATIRRVIQRIRLGIQLEHVDVDLDAELIDEEFVVPCGRRAGATGKRRG